MGIDTVVGGSLIKDGDPSRHIHCCIVTALLCSGANLVFSGLTTSAGSNIRAGKGFVLAELPVYLCDSYFIILLRSCLVALTTLVSEQN
jgi:hypothetical protein